MEVRLLRNHARTVVLHFLSFVSVEVCVSVSVSSFWTSMEVPGSPISDINLACDFLHQEDQC